MLIHPGNRSSKLEEYLALRQLDRIWFLSDTHFWHTNIIKYSNRPYRDVEEMNEAMRANWARLVKPNDIIIHGGDVMFKVGEHLSKMNEHLSYLPGYKVLVVGNHDYSYKRKLIELAFAEMHERLNFRVDDLYFAVTHYPLDVNYLTNENCYNIHGHTHTENIQNSDRHLNICVEQRNYQPINLADLIFSLDK